MGPPRGRPMYTTQPGTWRAGVPPHRSWAWQAILVLLCAPPAGAQAPPLEAGTEVRRYEAFRASPGISVDGHLNEAAWEAAPWTEPFVDILGPDGQEPLWETGAKMLWDDIYLYVAAYLVEPHLWATLEERDAIMYHDHDFEVFLDPERDGVGYYEFEVNALATLLDLFMDRPYSQGGDFALDWNAVGVRWAVHLDGTLNRPGDVDRGWSVELAIPWSSLVPPGSGKTREAPEDGDVWRVNFSRVQWPLRVVETGYRKEREPVDWNDHPEYNWVWSPQGVIDMHIPERWGAVTFRAVPPVGGHE